MASYFPIPLEKSLSNQYLQSDLHSAVVAIQSLVNLNNSRYETRARETRAAVVNMSMSDYGQNRNTNSMTTMEMDLRPSDSDRRIAVDDIPPAEQRRRSSVTFSRDPDGTNVKLYNPESKLQVNSNERGSAELPLRSSLKLNTESKALLYDRPGSIIQLGANDTTNPAEQRRVSTTRRSSEPFGTKSQLFENPTSTTDLAFSGTNYAEQPPMSQMQYQNGTQPSETGNRFGGGDTRPAGNDNTTEEMSYTAQVLVEVKVVFVRVMDIDTINQQFEADIYIQARWSESQFSGYSEEQLQEIDFRQCWNPKLTILNTIGYLESDRASMLLRYEPDRVYPILTYMWHVRGLFREILELQHFPFDVQEISIVISSGRSIREIELVCDYTQLSNVSPRALQGNQEWSAYRHVEFIRDYNTQETVSTTKHPILVAAGHVKRKMGFYFWNVCVIVLLILALSFTTLGIAPYLEDRLIVTMTLILTCIAFKLVVHTTLPNISYLTYLDIYVIFALVYLTMQAIENAIMIHLKKFKSHSKIEVYDEIAQSCLIALLIIFHLTFIIYIQVTAFSRRRSMTDKELDFELTRINLNKSAAESKAKASKERAELAGINARTGKVRPDENPVFTQTPTGNTYSPPMGDEQPIEVTNPLFREQ